MIPGGYPGFGTRSIQRHRVKWLEYCRLGGAAAKPAVLVTRLGRHLRKGGGPGKLLKTEFPPAWE